MSHSHPNPKFNNTHSRRGNIRESIAPARGAQITKNQLNGTKTERAAAEK
jgi:hypothetical protein